MINNIIGVGIDILDIRRLHRLLSKSPSSRVRFIKRILSSQEICSNEWKSIKHYPHQKAEASSSTSSGLQSRELQYLANRWAAKEAAFKALYPTFKPTWKELSVLKGQQIQLAFMTDPSSLQPTLLKSLSSKKPIIIFQPKNVVKISLPDLRMSLSHDGDHVVAIVVASSDGSPRLLK